MQHDLLHKRMQQGELPVMPPELRELWREVRKGQGVYKRTKVPCHTEQGHKKTVHV